MSACLFLVPGRANLQVSISCGTDAKKTSPRRVELMKGSNAGMLARKFVHVGKGPHVVDPTLMYSNWRLGVYT
jgi:hypothetical protein